MREHRALLLAVLLLGALAQAQDEAQKPRKVVAIRFEGNRRYSDAYLVEQIATKVGETFDRGLLVRDERLLREFFSAVLEIKENEVEGGVELVFKVLDDIVVGKVEYRGLARVRRKDFESLVTTRPGRPLLDHALKSDQDLLERLHREKGYHFVSVAHYKRRTKKADVLDVVFQVLTGRRVKVKRVVLEGVVSVDRHDLLAQVENSDRYRTRFLGLGKVFNPTYFKRAALEDDRRRMELHYRSEGWRDAKVVLTGIHFDARQKSCTIQYRVDEGRRYQVSSVAVEYAEGGEPQPGDREFLASPALAGLSVMARGAPFREEELRTSLRDMQERLWARAYALSRIEPRLLEDAGKHTVAVTLIVHPGPKVRLGRLRIFGNRWTRDNVIRRAFREGALSGDFLDVDELMAGQNRLLKLRYFSLVRFGNRSWGLVKSPDADQPDEYDVELEVEETNTRQITFGAGVSTDGGAFGTFSVTWRNFDISRPPDRFWRILDANAFRGGGQQFTLSASPGTTFSQFTIAFSDPALRDSRWSLSTSLYRRISLFDDYDQTVDGVSLGVGRFLDANFRWRLSLEWSLRQVILDDPEPDAPVNALDVQGANTVHGIGLTLRRNTDSGADPFLRGHVTTLRTSWFGTILGGHVDVVKVHFQHSSGWRTFRHENRAWQRVRLWLTADWAHALEDTPEVPIFERLFMGGRNLRGFEFREVGPRSNGRPTGGEFMLRVSTQYTIPLTSQERSGFGLDMVFFVDQGGLATELGDFGSDAWRISAGFGFGIAFGGPTQPPLQIDFGFPIRRRPGDAKQVVSIAFRRDF